MSKSNQNRPSTSSPTSSPKTETHQVSQKNKKQQTSSNMSLVLSKKGNSGTIKNFFTNATFFCSKCESKFSSFAALSSHCSTNCVEEVFECGHCDKTFVSKQALQSHSRNLNVEKNKYCCEHCGKVAYNPLSMKIHIEQMHTEYFDKVLNASCFKCKLCPRTESRRTGIIFHVNSEHLKKTTCMCEICGKNFYHERNLSRHLLTHNDEPSIECKICGKKFKTTNALTKHSRSHDPNAKYFCDECPKSFRKKQRFNEHKRMHSGDLPYMCGICDKKFLAKHQCVNHMKIHSE